MVETVYDLCQPSMLTAAFRAKAGSIVFPLWKWSKPRATPTQAISPWGALGERSLSPHLMTVYNVLECFKLNVPFEVAAYFDLEYQISL